MMPVLSVDITLLAVNTPLFNPTFPAAGLPLVQVPPAGASVNAAVTPAHNAVGPMIAPGSGLTVNEDTVLQPVGNIYVIFVTPPAANVGCTNPPPAPGPTVTVATLVTLLLHVPNGVASLNCEVWLKQIYILPVIAAGSGFTFNVVVIKHPVASV